MVQAPTLVTMETGPREALRGGGEGRMEEVAGPWAPCILLPNPCHLTPEQVVIHLGLPQVPSAGPQELLKQQQLLLLFPW